MLLYYITDRHAFPGAEAEKRVRLLAKIAEAARCGVDFIQLREKDLSPRELERLAREVVQVVRDHTPLDSSETATRILINSRTDIALAVVADGVHLTSNDVAASDARAIHEGFFTENRELRTENFLVAASCHTVNEVRLAEAQGADFAVFAPVFEKSVSIVRVPHPSRSEGWEPRQLISQRSQEEGLAALRSVCQALAHPNEVENLGTSQMPVLALGGVTLENARDCVDAGSAGIAAIRLFQDNDIAEVVRQLR